MPVAAVKAEMAVRSARQLLGSSVAMQDATGQPLTVLSQFGRLLVLEMDQGVHGFLARHGYWQQASPAPLAA